MKAASIAFLVLGAGHVTTSSAHPVAEENRPHWHFENRVITESSGVAVSKTQPGIFWTINDSGNAAEVYAFDQFGHDLGTWRIEGADNRDWEAIELAPCFDGRSNADCLYIGETGDNAEKHEYSAIYKIAEPQVTAESAVNGDLSLSLIQTLRFKYEDNSHDVEAFYITTDGRINLITKGRSNGIALYSFDPVTSSGTIATALRDFEFAITPNRSIGRWVTDASLASDGRMLAVRTYREVYLFDITVNLPNGAPLEPAAVCDLAILSEKQGEAIGWTDDHGVFLTTSEGDNKISRTICNF
ncbi:hypothetical protein [Pontixanthobacter gangjinensis]|uniref:Esterase-like activity of phytase n=1 Tax=Pontixanthobacter gangjinensis TaxID=1028742 RepID=A0A6I4SN85_9SPHN|nr:hypothetical protein [Pontixanthobacter gangjinensis]MXO56287.1 hypothetical protein [Pontixanthobacter gangjinensis]